ncbi:MAG: alanine-glyoxylate transaminase / serine-glyoxylate transaminase / serine-pyruvate transaminase [Solirubrobacteraceae bacterium]|nr:alanine-glyoxylate transaminase / serine-glyoxylate transaminase / serine-pyruvate transaminase [Solirubrobacteraceae bacterium]
MDPCRIVWFSSVEFNNLYAMTPNSSLSPLDPPERLLAGPGPSNVSPKVLEAMQKPMLSHLDPDMHDILLEVVDYQRQVYKAQGGLVLPHQATGSSGMECGLVNLLEPGDTAIVANTGFFGNRIAKMAKRTGANVVEVKADFGQIVPNERLLEELDRNPGARLIAVVHAETSTGVRHPVADLGAELRRRGGDTLLFVDCVTSLGAHDVQFDEWGIDYAYSCTQKALAAPPGMSPLAISDRALERVAKRTNPVPFTFDLDLLRKFWIDRPVTYHHTAPILHIYALHEALRGALEEGLEDRFQRHTDAGGYLQEEVRSRGLELLADPEYQLAQLTAVRVPEGVDGKQVQTRVLREHGIEIGGGLGPDAPPIWRIGLMGHNARREAADRVLTALDAVLADTKHLAPTA